MSGTIISSSVSYWHGLLSVLGWDRGLGWIFVMGFLVSAACGLAGNFMMLRRMTLMGDALSHSLLPGVVLAFLLTQSRSPMVMVIGAVLATMAAALLIEWIEKHSRLKKDAVIGIVFTSFFALGVLLINVFAAQVDLDGDCVLYGELGLIFLADPVTLWAGYQAPVPVVRMVVMVVVLVALIFIFYKEWVVTAFDPGLARTLGIPTGIFHYGFMMLLSLVIVSAFESVGVILVMAMLIFPGATASLLTKRLPQRLLFSCLLSALYAFGGLQLAITWDANIAGVMTVVAGGLFLLAWMADRLKQALRGSVLLR